MIEQLCFCPAAVAAGPLFSVSPNQMGIDPMKTPVEKIRVVLDRGKSGAGKVKIKYEAIFADGSREHLRTATKIYRHAILYDKPVKPGKDLAARTLFSNSPSYQPNFCQASLIGRFLVEDADQAERVLRAG